MWTWVSVWYSKHTSPAPHTQLTPLISLISHPSIFFLIFSWKNFLKGLLHGLKSVLGNHLDCPNHTLSPAPCWKCLCQSMIFRVSNQMAVSLFFRLSVGFHIFDHSLFPETLCVHKTANSWFPSCFNTCSFSVSFADSLSSAGFLHVGPSHAINSFF